MSTRMLQDIETDLIDSNHDESTGSFREMNLKSDLLRNTYGYGLENPSSIQQRTMMPMLQGNDLIIEAPCATGKTFAICIAALQMIDANLKSCQALIITPTAVVTRATQETIINLAQSLQIDCLAVVKSSSIDQDMSTLYQGQQCLIGSPGHTLKLVQRSAIKLDNLKLLVLDGADEIMARGFGERIAEIQHFVPKSAQVVVSSITAPDEVLDVAQKLTHDDPLHIVVKGKTFPFSSIKQFHIAVETDDLKLNLLSDLLTNFDALQIVIFCNLRKKVEWLAGALTARGIVNCHMQADMPAYERGDIIQQFRNKTFRILLVTNMLARSTNERKSSLVINYELPSKPEEYLHRTSYDTHCESQSTTINLVCPNEASMLHEIEALYSCQIQELKIPESRKISEVIANIL